VGHLTVSKSLWVILFQLSHVLSFGKKKYGQEMLGRYPVLHLHIPIVFLTVPAHQIKLDLSLKNQPNSQKLCSISGLFPEHCGTQEVEWVLRGRDSMWSGEGRTT